MDKGTLPDPKEWALTPSASKDLQALPVDVLFHIVDRLQRDEVARIEMLNKHFREEFISGGICRRLCQGCLASWHVTDIKPEGVGQFHADNARVQSSACYKRMYACLVKPSAKFNADLSIIEKGCQASSTGSCKYPMWNPAHTHTISMHIDYLLTPYGGDYTPRYWCSESSIEQSMTDVLQFELVHPVCLIREVQIEPYTEKPKAAQYHPCSVRFFFSTGLNDHDGQQTFQTTEYFPLLHGGHTGTVSCEHGRSHGPEVWPQLQSFPVSPTLCIGGGFKVEVKGRAQQLDQTFCSRINYLKLIGTPLCNIIPCELAAEFNCNNLMITSSDPLEQRGGIRKCSENGRTAIDDEALVLFDLVLQSGIAEDIAANWIR